MGFVNGSDATKILSGYVETGAMPDFLKLNVLTAMELLRQTSERTAKIPVPALD